MLTTRTFRHRAVVLCVSLAFFLMWTLWVWFLCIPTALATSAPSLWAFVATVTLLAASLMPFTPEIGIWDEARVSDGIPASQVYPFVVKLDRRAGA